MLWSRVRASCVSVWMQAGGVWLLLLLPLVVVMLVLLAATADAMREQRERL